MISTEIGCNIYTFRWRCYQITGWAVGSMASLPANVWLGKLQIYSRWIRLTFAMNLCILFSFLLSKFFLPCKRHWSCCLIALGKTETNIMRFAQNNEHCKHLINNESNGDDNTQISRCNDKARVRKSQCSYGLKRFHGCPLLRRFIKIDQVKLTDWLTNLESDRTDWLTEWLTQR